MEQKVNNARIAHLLQSQGPLAKPRPIGDRGAFEAIFSERLKLSGHAQTRMASRNIQLAHDQWQRVLSGVEKAEAKGARESLVMVDDVALIVSVKNRTIITAVDQGSLKENVFTNIDSALFV